MWKEEKCLPYLGTEQRFPCRLFSNPVTKFTELATDRL